MALKHTIGKLEVNGLNLINWKIKKKNPGYFFKFFDETQEEFKVLKYWKK